MFWHVVCYCWFLLQDLGILPSSNLNFLCWAAFPYDGFLSSCGTSPEIHEEQTDRAIPYPDNWRSLLHEVPPTPSIQVTTPTPPPPPQPQSHPTTSRKVSFALLSGKVSFISVISLWNLKKDWNTTSPVIVLAQWTAEWEWLKHSITGISLWAWPC